MLMHRAFISRRRGLLSLSLGLLLVFLPVTSAFALDYTITEVIEIGEAGFAPFVNPIIWSPDGTKIAFTKAGVIYFSDTLGNVQEVIKPEMPLHRWAWVSDSQIAVYTRKYTGHGGDLVHRISTIDVNLKKETALQDFNTFYGFREVEGFSEYYGPLKSIEGNSYYAQKRYSSIKSNISVIPLTFEQSKSAQIANDHFLRWSDSGLYKVRLDHSDSTWLVGLPIMMTSLYPVANFECTYAMDKGHLIRLRDTTIILVDTLIGPLPPNTDGCAILWSSFNPVAPEILFTISCSKGENYPVNRIATLDYNTFQLTVIDTITGLTSCAAPAYSPNGKKIALMSRNRAYILTREFE